jgi:hypothetical protein
MIAINLENGSLFKFADEAQENLALYNCIVG